MAGANQESVTAVHYGVGPIGQRLVELAVDRDYELVGAIDIDPDKVGKDLGTIVGLGELGVPVTDDAEAVLATDPDIVLHATVSSIAAAAPQFTQILEAGADVISTCEELVYPWRAAEEIATQLDATATANDATLLGTGINPGFVMDAFPAFLTTACQDIEAVRIERIQDAAIRRPPLQEKIGAGMTVEAFNEHIVGTGGHVGLPESVALLAEALEMDIGVIDDSLQPVVADEPTASEYITVSEGEVAGIHQTVHAEGSTGCRIDLDLKMYLGASDPRDHVSITGTPSVDCRVPGGLHGDVTTPAVVLNTVERVRQAPAGLATMLDLSIPACPTG